MRVNVAQKANLHIPLEVVKKIRYACSSINDVEWSGRIFYKVLEGTLEKVDDLKLEAVDIYLEDKGSSAYTEYEASEDIMDLFEEFPHLEDCKVGMIHSHVDMGTFFSGTDTSELEDNHSHYEMYLSLIVNNRGDYCAKIAVPGKRISKTHTKTTSEVRYKSHGEWIIKPNNTEEDVEEEESLMFVVDCNVSEEPLPEPQIDDFFKRRVEEIIEAAKTVTTTYTNRYWGDRYNNNGYPKTSYDPFDPQTEMEFSEGRHTGFPEIDKPSTDPVDNDTEDVKFVVTPEEFAKFFTIVLSKGESEDDDTLADVLTQITRKERSASNMEIYVTECVAELFIHTQYEVFGTYLSNEEEEQLVVTSIGYFENIMKKGINVNLCKVIIEELKTELV